MGTWTIRMLVGHLSRSFVTLIEYSSQIADKRSVASAADYYLVTAQAVDPAAIHARAQHAADALGERPLEAVQSLRDRAMTVLASIGDPIIPTIAGGMLLSDYVPTRTFELAVHSLDLARALGRPDDLPPAVAGAALDLAVAIADRRGQTQSLLLALTGRVPLPPGFSVV